VSNVLKGAGAQPIVLGNSRIRLRLLGWRGIGTITALKTAGDVGFERQAVLS